MSTNGQAKVLTHNEIARLFAAMGSPRDQALFGILLYGGLRVSEAISLRPGDNFDCNSQFWGVIAKTTVYQGLVHLFTLTGVECSN